ncbi:hypothetical protein RJ641_036043 [Dillenia turbinata]|uniref:Uncharacterized protein n=1 Tax=Dillenia turbinata TaxID=194707 RepID=A0AAN8ZAN0_9MAGN
MASTTKPKVAVIREEGSNGDREMSAAFYAAGFEPWDICNMYLTLQRVVSFYTIQSASSRSISKSSTTDQTLLAWGSATDVSSWLYWGWVPGPQVGGVHGVSGDPSPQPRFVHNESGRFECGFTSVTIKDSPAIMFKGMKGSTLGVWAAHGEGKRISLITGALLLNVAVPMVSKKHWDVDQGAHAL